MTPGLPPSARAVLIGAATGLRSQWGVAAVALTTPCDATVPPASALARPWVKAATLAAAAGEFVADKHPDIPDRLSPRGLVPRLVLGALAASALTARRHSGAPPLAAAGGAATAALAAVAGWQWRKHTPRPTRPDPVAAALEDLAALALACTACSDRRSNTPVAASAATGEQHEEPPQTAAGPPEEAHQLESHRDPPGDV